MWKTDAWGFGKAVAIGALTDGFGVIVRGVQFHFVEFLKAGLFERLEGLLSTVNTSTGQVTVISTNDEGKEKTYSEQMKLPADVASGLFTSIVHSGRINSSGDSLEDQNRLRPNRRVVAPIVGKEPSIFVPGLPEERLRAS